MEGIVHGVYALMCILGAIYHIYRAAVSRNSTIAVNSPRAGNQHYHDEISPNTM